MRTLMSLILIFGLTACTAAAPPVPDSKAGMKAETEQLIRCSLTERLLENAKSIYRKQANSMLAANTESPEKVSQIVDEELQQLSEPEHKRLVDALVPIYMRIFTPTEIHQLLSFYRTDVARKSMKVSTQIAAESQQYIRQWSEHFGDQLLQRIDTRLTEAGIQIKQ